MQTQRAEMNEDNSPIKNGWTETHNYNKADWKARTGVAILAGGGAVCGLILALGEGVNFIRGCAVEDLVWYAMRLPPSDLVQCAKETWPMLQGFLGK